MACEDYPCCGHEPGDCPRIDSKGRQRFTCVNCGEELKIGASSSICARCLKRMARRLDWDDHDFGMNG